MADNKFKESALYQSMRRAYYGLRAAAQVQKEPPLSLEAHENTFSLDLNRRGNLMYEYRRLALKHGKNIPSSTIADYYFDEKLDEKAIVMIGLGHNVRGSLQYILNELNTSEKFKDFRIYVRTSKDTNRIVKEYIRQNHWDRTETVLAQKPYSRLLESCKYLITEVYMPEGWVKKPGQIFISIWHGTPLKRLGLAKLSSNCHINGTTQKNFMDADYLTYPNAYTREKMLESYKVSQLMNGRAVMLGYPRTGGMLAASQADQRELRSQLAPQGEHLYAFMPTFRDYLTDDQAVEETQAFLNYLDENLREDQLLYVNLHHKLNASIDYSAYRRIRPFPPTVDSYKLLAETEALISDYSSVFFDYLALRRQIILYIPDYQEYCKKRGTYMDLMSLPFDKAMSKGEVLEAINRGKTYDDEAAWNTFCSHDTVDNAKKVCQLFFRDETGLEAEDIPRDSRRRILIYSDAFEPGCETELLHAFTREYDRTQWDVYLSCDMNAVDQNKSSAYPMLFENSVIGAERAPHLSGLGKVVRELYHENKITFETALRYLKYDYALVPKRIYGQARFDAVLIYDVDDPERIISLAEMGVPTILCLPEAVLEKAKGQDPFLRDALRYAAKYSRGVYTFSARHKDDAGALLGGYWKDRIQTAESPDHLANAINSILEAKESI